MLIYLVENRDRVVSKNELMKAVWPRSVVEENNLNQAVTILRRALGDRRDSPQFVRTIAGRGYRFVGDVSEEAAETEPGPPDSLRLLRPYRPTPLPRAPNLPCIRWRCREAGSAAEQPRRCSGPTRHAAAAPAARLGVSHRRSGRHGLVARRVDARRNAPHGCAPSPCCPSGRWSKNRAIPRWNSAWRIR